MAYRRRNKLTPKETRFICEYLIDRNAQQAAIRAGYKASTKWGYKLLKRPAIAEAVAKASAEQAARNAITADRVLQELELLTFSDITHYTVEERGRVSLAPGAPANAMRAVRSVKHKVRHDKAGGVTYETELTLWDKVTPLRLAGRHVGLFPDRVEDDRVEELAAKLMTRQLERVRAQLEAERQEPIEVTAKAVTP